MVSEPKYHGIMKAPRILRLRHTIEVGGSWDGSVFEPVLDGSWQFLFGPACRDA